MWYLQMKDMDGCWRIVDTSNNVSGLEMMANRLEENGKEVRVVPEKKKEPVQ